MTNSGRKSKRENERMSFLFRYVDLFAGMGGIRLGLEQALSEKGIEGECVLTSEIKPYALKVYKDNFGEDNIKGDISQIEGKDIPDFDMLLAGFPCFVGDTLIYTTEGYKPIKDIEIGMKVLTHKNRFKEVVEVMQQETTELYEIRVSKQLSILTTANHPFYVRTKNNSEPLWVEAKHLTEECYYHPTLEK